MTKLYDHKPPIHHIVKICGQWFIQGPGSDSSFPFETEELAEKVREFLHEAFFLGHKAGEISRMNLMRKAFADPD